MIDLFHFELLGSFSIVKNNCLLHYDNVFDEKYLLDNYNHLRYNKNSVSVIESKDI